MIHSTKEYLLFAENQKIKAEDYRFVPARFFSPYMECNPTTLNRISLEDSVVEVNPFFRYEKIFAELLNSNEADQYEELKAFVFDFWIREIYQCERLEGATRRSLERGELKEELLFGACGESTKRALEAFEGEEQEFISDCLISLYDGADELHLFTKVVKRILPEASIYVLDQNEVLIYAGESETYSVRNKIQCAQYLFLPIGAKTDIFWEKHFGVWGIDESMRLDEVVVI